MLGRSKWIWFCSAAVMLLIARGSYSVETQCGLSAMEQLGKSLFFDTNLSSPKGQACAACHGPQVGYTGPDSAVNTAGAVYPGAAPHRFGNRKPPTAAYAGDSPILTYDEITGAWFGGMFWDGRASGWTLGDPLAEQAKGPFLNPLEQNLSNATVLCNRVKRSNYAWLYKWVWGEREMNCGHDAEQVYERIARSIAAYERSAEVNPFSSKYDGYLAGTETLTPIEQEGLALFDGKGKCASCHISDTSAGSPLFTDFGYDNLGVPKNPDNPFYDMPPEWNPDGEDWVDEGLGGFLRQAGYDETTVESAIGKHKVPTLRNVDRRPSSAVVKAYGHNGYFKSLEEIVHFYNTRDVPGAGWMGEPWPEPEVGLNLNTALMGDLGLTDDEEAAIVAFMKTLSDRP